MVPTLFNHSTVELCDIWYRRRSSEGAVRGDPGSSLTGAAVKWANLSGRSTEQSFAAQSQVFREERHLKGEEMTFNGGMT